MTWVDGIEPKIDVGRIPRGDTILGIPFQIIRNNTIVRIVTVYECRVDVFRIPLRSGDPKGRSFGTINLRLIGNKEREIHIEKRLMNQAFTRKYDVWDQNVCVKILRIHLADRKS